MADNVTLPGTGEIVATDDIGGVQFQRVKLTSGAEGTAVDVSDAAPLPVGAVGELIEAIEALRMTVGQLANGIGRAMPDTAGRLRIGLDSISGNLALGQVNTINTLSTVATLTVLSNFGNWSATPHTPALMGVGVDSLRRNISVT